jgi:hypothetical protein
MIEEINGPFQGNGHGSDGEKEEGPHKDPAQPEKLKERTCC